MSLHHSPRIVTDGLVMCLDAADKGSYPGSGTAWKDLLGNSNDGTLVNGPTFDSGNLGSIVFDGTDDYVSFQSNLEIGGASNSGITVEFTFNYELLPNLVPGEVSYAGLYSGDGRILIQRSSEIILVQTGNGSFFSNNPTSCPPGNWNVVTYAVDYLTQMEYIYVNSELLGEQSRTFEYILNLNNITLPTGNGPTSNFYKFKGNLSNIKFYNRALTSDEILQNYNATKSRFNL